MPAVPRQAAARADRGHLRLGPIPASRAAKKIVAASRGDAPSTEPGQRDSVITELPEGRAVVSRERAARVPSAGADNPKNQFCTSSARSFDCAILVV
jgi:hypothetical protein